MKLKDVIALFPLYAEIHEEIHAENNLPDNFKELTYREKLSYINYWDYKIIILKKSDSLLLFCRYLQTVVRCGKNIFIRSRLTDSIVIEDNKLKVKTVNLEFLFQFLQNCNIIWCRDFLTSNDYCYLFKSSILKAIITHKIFNEETFYKAIASRIFHIKVGWRLLRDYIRIDTGYKPEFNLIDINAFTKSLEYSLKRIIDNKYNYSKLNTLNDLLNCAVKLDEIVDFTWSDKRIQEEHLRQIRLLEKENISKKENKPIFDSVIEAPNIKMLNTELDVYMEGLQMHHCLYTCYWQRIKNRSYVAFHMSFPEDCTFSCTLKDDNIIFDQIYSKYDQLVRPETKCLANDFIINNQTLLKKLLNKDNTHTLVFEQPWIPTDPEVLNDIPF